jgi:hypothetical protein
MFACQLGVAAHGPVSDFGQATRLTHPVAFGDVFPKGNDLVLGQSGVEKNGTGILGERSLAMPTPEQSGVGIAILGANSDIFFATNAVFRAVFILTAEVWEIVHDTASLIPSPLKIKA